jgi:hypothetical protein
MNSVSDDRHESWTPKSGSDLQGLIATLKSAEAKAE